MPTWAQTTAIVGIAFALAASEGCSRKSGSSSQTQPQAQTGNAPQGGQSDKPSPAKALASIEPATPPAKPAGTQQQPKNNQAKGAPGAGAGAKPGGNQTEASADKPETFFVPRIEKDDTPSAVVSGAQSPPSPSDLQPLNTDTGPYVQRPGGYWGYEGWFGGFVGGRYVVRGGHPPTPTHGGGRHK